MTSVTSFGCLLLILNIFHRFFQCFYYYFEQVNIYWEIWELVHCWVLCRNPNPVKNGKISFVLQLKLEFFLTLSYFFFVVQSNSEFESRLMIRFVCNGLKQNSENQQQSCLNYKNYLGLDCVSNSKVGSVMPTECLVFQCKILCFDNFGQTLNLVLVYL